MNNQSLRNIALNNIKKGFVVNPKSFISLIGGMVLAVLVVEIVFLTSFDVFSIEAIQARTTIGDRFEKYALKSTPASVEADDASAGFPENKDRELKYTSVSTITAYNSEVAQCNASPCITANGYNLCTSEESNTVAANHLPFGTKIRIPEHFGDKVFVVRDRMNSRYSNRVDVWMQEKDDAIEFGIKRAQIEVLE